MTTETPPPEPPPEEDEGTIEDPAKLKGLYDKKKAENTTLRKRATTAEERAEKAEKALEEFQAQTMTDTEKLIETARKEAAAEVEGRYESLLKTERLRARAAGKLNDPEDAIRLLDLEELAIDDEKGMDEAISNLVKAKPYLAAKYQVPPIDQGPQGPDPEPKEDANSWLRRAIGSGQQ